MRDIIQGSMNDAKSLIQDVMGEVRALSDEQVVTRYVQEHRGNPQAIMNFARQGTPRGADVFEQAVRYENEMEELLKNARGGK